MVKSFALTLLVLTTLAVPSFSHPGEEHDYVSEIARRAAYNAHLSRSIARCAGHPTTMKLQKEAKMRRLEKAESLRAARGLPAKPFLMGRDSAALKKFENMNHNETSQGYTLDTSASTLFSGNTSCILTPEVTQGPYYITGEHVRSNVTEGQAGVPVHVEFQFIDVSTCSAATGLHTDLWHVNATGVYSGVIAAGNGDNSDDTNLNATFCRGIQPTTSSGVVSFDTIFPGHYSGRTTHMHVLAHHGGSVLDNNTFSGGNISHVGQVFFPETLRTLVEATSPYSTNQQSYVLNVDDSIAGGEAENGYDPFPYWTMLGDSVSDGLLMWIEIGIDLSSDYNVTAAGALTEDGGVANQNAMGNFGGGGGGGGPPTGAMPTGAMPTGAMPTGGVPASGSGEPASAAFSTTAGSEGALVTSISVTGTTSSAAAAVVQSGSAAASSSAAAAASSSSALTTSSAGRLRPLKIWGSLMTVFQWLWTQG